MDKFAILVNTCDKFEDCWNPFFQLFTIYWPDYKGKIYLNTEYKTYSYGNLDIHSVKGCQAKEDAHQIAWSECLKRALESINNDIVLYLQEDYFLKDRVKTDLVEHYADLMRNNAIDCIHLTDQGVKAEAPSEEFDKLWTVPLHDKDRISCQAALWKKSVLLQYIRDYETGWNFEWWGSKRAAIFKHHFYTVDRNWVKINQFEIIPYVFTGVIGGKWFHEVVPLFEKHQIPMDFSKRGFFERKKRSLKQRFESKLKRFPNDLRSSIDLIRLKLFYK
jgi:hypothetical protein